MRIKRVYDHSSGSPVLSHLRILSSPEVQKLSTGLVDRLVIQGVLTLGQGRATFKTADGEPDVVYRIVAGPGYYCCHCDAPQDGPQEAQRHVREAHGGRECPDPNNPSGYRNDACYTCVLAGEGEELDARQAEAKAQEQRRKVNERLGDRYRRKDPPPGGAPPAEQPKKEGE